MGQGASNSEQSIPPTKSTRPVQKFMNSAELENLLTNDELKSKVLVIDVRGGSDGDFKGGHITNATNIPYQQLLSNHGWNQIIEKDIIENKIEYIVFHCMYSMVRGPASYDRFAVIVNQIIQQYSTLLDKGNTSSNDCCVNATNHENKKYKIELKNQQLTFQIDNQIYQSLKNIKLYILKGGFYDWIEKYMKYYETDKALFDKLVTDYDATIWSKNSKTVMQQEKDEQQMNQNKVIQALSH